MRTRFARRDTRRSAACARPPDRPPGLAASIFRRPRARRPRGLARRVPYKTLRLLARAMASRVAARSGCLISAPSRGTSPLAVKNTRAASGECCKPCALVLDRAAAGVRRAGSLRAPGESRAAGSLSRAICRSDAPDTRKPRARRESPPPKGRSVEACSMGLPAVSRYMSRLAAPGAFSRASTMVSRPSD